MDYSVTFERKLVRELSNLQLFETFIFLNRTNKNN
jgi:hypothetical protein